MLDFVSPICFGFISGWFESGFPVDCSVVIVWPYRVWFPNAINNMGSLCLVLGSANLRVLLPCLNSVVQYCFGL